MNEDEKPGFCAAIWEFIQTLRGEEFSAATVAAALPHLSRAGIRSYLYYLVRIGRLEATATTGKSYIYRQRPRQEEAAPDSWAATFNAIIRSWTEERAKRRRAELDADDEGANPDELVPLKLAA